MAINLREMRQEVGRRCRFALYQFGEGAEIVEKEMGIYLEFERVELEFTADAS